MVELKDRSLATASAEYRDRRRELLSAETELRDRIEAVAALRRALPPGPVVPDYILTEGPSALDDAEHLSWPRTLPDLLDPAHEHLVIYHLMFWETGGCPMCSMWIDGLNGVAAHLAQHLSLIIVAPAPLPRMRAWGRDRGWNRLRLLSSAGTTLGEDFGASAGLKDQMPAVTVLTRSDNDRLRHSWTGQATLPGGGRGIDSLSPVWSVLDLTPGGRPDWWPGNDYPVSWVSGRPASAVTGQADA